MEGHDGHLTPQSHELESVNHGIGKDTPQTAYTQMQSNGFSQMFESLQLKPQICEETKDCIPKSKNDKENIYYVCCWVPGNSEGEQHCVQNVSKPSALFLKLKFTPPKRDLDDIRRQRNTFHMLSPKSLEVLVLPVGQGDCVAMYCPNGHLVMYDCGSNSQQDALTSDEVKYAILEKVKSVTIFISHGDLDHYKYLPLLFPADGQVNIDHVIIGGILEQYTKIQD